MHSKPVIGQTEVARLLAAARQEALAHQWNVTIAVVDDGGHPLGLERMDGCAAASAYIAVEKARSSALGRKETRDYEQMVNGGRTAFVTAPLLTCLEGGVPLRVDGQVVGAIGVSGVKPEQDAQVAKAGAAAIT
ncbi:heme-binding protein [Pseudomonas putida]|uniref:heme-binding protein n=1 Tax=Pseudomonas TaxID=286 RepID=UPI00226FE1BB|nr:heme-binding protein [Pseudomonas putida]WAC00227.1 heme-binding protein [Pseudomonas putida]